SPWAFLEGGGRTGDGGNHPGHPLLPFRIADEHPAPLPSTLHLSSSPQMTPIVVKIGGSLMERPEALRGLTKALAGLWLGGMPLVLAHGGGKDINRNLAWLGEEPRF